jgi:hypothetical protein
MAGLILNAVGEKLGNQKINQLIYLCAYIPPSNSPISEISNRSSQSDVKTAALLLADPAQIGVFRLDPNSVDPAYRSILKSSFYEDVNATDFQAITNFLTPDEPVQPITALVPLSQQQWGSIPRTYIKCTEDWAIRPATQSQMITDVDVFTPNNLTQVISLTSSHSPFFSQPEKLADALIASLQNG